MGRARTAAVTLALALATTVAAGCGGSPSPEPQRPAGAVVDVLGLWSGPELDAFTTVAGRWEATTGYRLAWHGSQDVARDLATRLDAGDPPHVAVLPNPGLLHDLADDGVLLPLEPVVGAYRLAHDYPATWLDLGRHDGTLAGVVVTASSKATVWYAPRVLAAAGYTVPSTWAELTALADRVVADGRSPFVLVAPRGPGSGWALTDLVAQLVLTGCGPALYDAWVAADVAWTDPCVRAAFERVGTLLHTPGYVLDGARGVLTTSDADGVAPVYADPPAAYLYPMASFAEGFVTAAHPELEPGTGYDWFPLPPADPAHAGAVTVGGDLVVLLRDTPAARDLVTYLVGADAQEEWVALGGFTSAHRAVPPEAYPDVVSRRLADVLVSARVVRFGAGDAMPSAVQRAWWQAMLAYAEDPHTLDGSLTLLTTTAAASR